MALDPTDATITDSKPVDHPSRETVKVRQGTGPHATVTVLVVSLFAAAVIGAPKSMKNIGAGTSRELSTKSSGRALDEP